MTISDRNAQGFLTLPEKDENQQKLDYQKKVFIYQQELKSEQFELILKILHKLEHNKVEMESQIKRFRQKKQDRKSMRKAPQGLQQNLKRVLKDYRVEYKYKQDEYISESGVLDQLNHKILTLQQDHIIIQNRIQLLRHFRAKTDCQVESFNNQFA